LERSYLDLSAAGVRGEKDAFRLADETLVTLRRDLELSLSGGLGSSPLMARIATALVRPRGLGLLCGGYERAFLKKLPLSKIPGLDRDMVQALKHFNIRYVGEVATVSKEVLVETFGESGAWLHDFSLGHDPRPMEIASRPTKVSRAANLKEAVQTFGVLFGYLSYLAERAMKEVLALGMAVTAVIVHLQFADGLLKSKRQRLPCATAHEANMIPVIDRLIRILYVRRMGVFRVGVTLDGLVPRSEHQRSLFVDDRADRDERLHTALQHIRKRHGFDSILRGPALEIAGEFPADDF
jgi:DNA polymerase-4